MHLSMPAVAWRWCSNVFDQGRRPATITGVLF